MPAPAVNESYRRDLFGERDKQNQCEDLRRAYDRRQGDLLSERQSLLDERKTLESQNRIEGRWSSESAERCERLQVIEREIERRDRELAELPHRRSAGVDCIQSASVTQGSEDEIVIRSKLGPPQPRLGFERPDRCGVERREGYDVSHSQGAGTGFECDCGLFQARPEVNRTQQNQGIEARLRDLYAEKRPEVDLWLTTETRYKSGTKELASISYSVDAKEADGRTAKLWSVTLEADSRGVAKATSVEVGCSEAEVLRPARQSSVTQRHSLGM